MTEHRLPYDYSRCPGWIDCPRADRCLRRLAHGRPGGEQSFTAFPAGADCHGFIPAEGDHD